MNVRIDDLRLSTVYTYLNSTVKDFCHRNFAQEFVNKLVRAGVSLIPCLLAPMKCQSLIANTLGRPLTLEAPLTLASDLLDPHPASQPSGSQRKCLREIRPYSSSSVRYL